TLWACARGTCRSPPNESQPRSTRRRARVIAVVRSRERRMRAFSWTLSRYTIATLLAALSLGALADDLTDRAKRLLAQGQGKQAYELLRPQESARAGDPEFDHLLGIAALDAGENER